MQATRPGSNQWNGADRAKLEAVAAKLGYEFDNLSSVAQQALAAKVLAAPAAPAPQPDTARRDTDHDEDDDDDDEPAPRTTRTPPPPHAPPRATRSGPSSAMPRVPRAPRMALSEAHTLVRNLVLIVLVGGISLALWYWDANFTLDGFGVFGVAMRGWVLSAVGLERIPLYYGIPLALSIFQALYFPLVFRSRQPYVRVNGSSGWFFAIWCVVFIINVGTNWTGVGAWLAGRNIPLFAGFALPTSGFGFVVMTFCVATFVSLAPERLLNALWQEVR